MFFSRLFAAIMLLSMLSFADARGQAQALLETLTSDLNIEGLETSYDPTTGLALAKGDVRISYADVEIRCGQASYNATTGEVIARDQVVIWKAGVTYKGDNIIYNSTSGEISGDAVRSSQAMEYGSLFFETDRFESETKLSKVVQGGETYITTHDSEKPNFRLRARGIKVEPGDKITLKSVTVLAGETPVFYLPQLSQPLGEEAGYRFNLGQQSRWGAFMLNTYTATHGEHTRARYKFDLRSARGVAVGADFQSLRHQNNWQNFSGLKFYFMRDSAPDKNRTSEVRRNVSENRYRVNLQHRIYLPGPEKSTWYLDFDINKISDAHFYEDFFFNDFRDTPEPDNQISLVKNTPSYLATLMTRFQANNFYRVGEKLPELAIDWTRRPLWDTGLYHQGTIAAGYLRERGAYFEDEVLQKISGASYAQFARFHTYHELLYPKTLFGWLNVVPRLGLGLTQYTGVQGFANGLPNTPDFQSDSKFLFHAGLDASFKLTKTWNDIDNETLGLDGLKHVVQPYVNVSYLDASRPEHFPSIDRLSRTTRIRPIDLSLYSAVDDLRSWNITRVGLKNFFQTRRDYTSENNGRILSANDAPTQTYTFAGMNTYLDLIGNDPEFDRSISNLYNEIFFKPVPWINLWMDMQLPINGDDGNFTEFNQGITFMPASTMSLTMGHQYISNSPFFQDSNLFFARTYARLNDSWGFSMYHVYEMDDSTMEFQSYSVTRDLTSWVASIGAMQRDNRNGRTEFGILFSLTLKDLPGVTVPLDIDPNPSGRGGSQ